MNRKYYLLFLIPFFIITSISIVFATSNTVSGTLKDANSNPVITKIELVHDPNVYSTVSSRTDGSYSLSIPTDWYILKFSSVNVTSNMPRFFEVEKNVTIQTTIVQNITPPISTITFNLRYNNGSAVQGAILDSGVGQVNLDGYTGTEEDLSITDSSGNVVLHLLPATFNNVKITLPSGQVFFPSIGRTVTLSGNGNYNLTVPSNPTVSGTVEDINGVPIRAIIELVANDYVERTQTDSSGAYSYSVPSGNYTIKYSQLFTNQTNVPKYFDAEKPVTISSTQTQSISAPILSLTGSINKTGMPIKVRNALSIGGYSGFSLDDTTTDSSGHFSVKLIQSLVSLVQIRINGTDVVYSCNINGSQIVC